MSLCVVQHPLGHEPSSWLWRVLGYPSQPIYRYPDSVILRCLNEAYRQNYSNAAKWHGRIGKITLK